jgi:hypothetical protein
MVALASMGSAASAQTQINARVMVMVDTSGSMVDHLTDNNPTFGDGSNGYKDSQTNMPTYYRGVPPGGVTCGPLGCGPSGICGAGFDGVNSRLFAAKQALTNVLNGAGDIDWGLMRYTGNQCPVSATPFTAHTCTANNQCVSNSCPAGVPRVCRCTTDIDCVQGEVCSNPTSGNLAGTCGTDSNLCNSSTGNPSNNYWITNNACNALFFLPISYAGTCGTQGTTGAGLCGSPETCYADTDCTGTLAGRCALVGTGPVRSCQCNVAGATCPAGYTCGAGNRCIYNTPCQSDGGFILSDPATAPSSAVFQYVNNLEDYTPKAGGPFGITDPELRADGNTPLAGAARTATTWYNGIKTGGLDPQITCRPYVLVQMTDGFDTCEGGANGSINAPFSGYETTGPVAAAQGFVAATAPNAKSLNKVYVIGLAFGGLPTTTLDNIAAAGGTGKARLANSATDIEAALADIVSSSVLVEKCNNADDNCNGQCDENFPDVLVNGAGCTNPHPAKTCDNGALAGTHCFATGTFVCSADTLSEQCNAPTCATNAALCPTAETCNGLDDDCNGVIDDCTAFVPGSCCTSCTPQPETCNGKDDDCDGIIDNHLTDTGLACGSNVGDCSPGTTQCCAGGNPATCGTHVATDQLTCVGGTAPTPEVCDGTDNDCDGVVDNISRACYPFASGTPGTGACRNGTQACNAVPCGTAPNGCCPAGWPAGKPCPGAAMFGACSGAVGPSPEVCNGQDDDCNGVVDNNVTDPWVGTACCPTGNNADCTNTGTGTRCKLGAFQCVGGAKQCVGGIAKSPETCNNVDDDCNGLTDDNIPGNGAACSSATVNGTPPCTAQYQCVAPKPGSGPNGLTCVQLVGPMPEICNGVDDDCDGQIDEPAAVAANDPRVGKVGGSPCTPLVPLPGTMFPATGAAPPCNPGTTACVNGMVVCQGEVQPQPNQCNGVSTDCTGMTNTNGNCPSGFQCYQGNCYTPCSTGEFPCPGGFVCLPSMNICIPDACAAKNCPPGQLCNIDNNGNAVCSDPCATVTCPTGFKCQLGACVDNSCKTQGCPTGQICTGNPPMCTPDPCFNVMCTAPMFCNNGQCVSPCNMCPSGEICLNGKCTMDPCKTVMCPQGQICALMQGVGMCVDNMCAGGCGAGLACCGGQCTIDPCNNTQCPDGQACKLDAECNVNCQTVPKDQIVGAGGGGFSCAMGGGTPNYNGLLFAALILGLALVRRRFSVGGGR